MAAGRALKAFATHALAQRLCRAALDGLGDADVMPIKGALYARTLYADPTERPLSDVDLVLLRPGVREGIRRLVRAGFAVRSFSSDLHVELTTLRIPGLSLDLHHAPLSAGYGAMTAAWLAHDAREDTSLFGARVLVPTAPRLLAITLGAIVRDHLDRSAPHAAHDVDALLHRANLSIDDAARAIADARFRRGAWAALAWTRRLCPSPALDALSDALALSAVERAWASRCVALFSSLSHTRAPRRRAALLACLMTDAPRDMATGVIALAAGLPIGVLNRHIRHEAIPW